MPKALSVPRPSNAAGDAIPPGEEVQRLALMKQLLEKSGLLPSSQMAPPQAPAQLDPQVLQQVQQKQASTGMIQGLTNNRSPTLWGVRHGDYGGPMQSGPAWQTVHGQDIAPLQQEHLRVGNANQLQDLLNHYHAQQQAARQQDLSTVQGLVQREGQANAAKSAAAEQSRQFNRSDETARRGQDIKGQPKPAKPNTPAEKAAEAATDRAIKTGEELRDFISARPNHSVMAWAAAANSPLGAAGSALGANKKEIDAHREFHKKWDTFGTDTALATEPRRMTGEMQAKYTSGMTPGTLDNNDVALSSLETTLEKLHARKASFHPEGMLAEHASAEPSDEDITAYANGVK